MSERCRHTGTWFLAGGRVEWCWQCGALRALHIVGENACEPKGRWTKPRGKDGENPWDYYKRDLPARAAHQGGDGE